MPNLPERREQIRRAHSRLIHMVVAACRDPGALPPLQGHLDVAAANGWTELVQALRAILAGRRDEGLLHNLDDEDRVIVESVLEGLQDGSRLPSLEASADPGLAAPGLAQLIHAARGGDVHALAWLGHMASQMQRAGGDMARLGGALGPLSRASVDPAVLTRGMGPSARELVHRIIEELAKLQAH